MVLAVLFISLFIVLLIIFFAFYPIKLKGRAYEARDQEPIYAPTTTPRLGKSTTKARNSGVCVEEIYDDPEL